MAGIFSMSCAPKEPDTRIVNQVLCKATELPPGTKKTFKVHDVPILVINDDGTYYAVSGKCAHYDYDLEKGIYLNGKLRCTLHGACYNVKKNADIEDHPGFDSLFSYSVKDINGDLVLNTSESQLVGTRRTRDCTINATSEEDPIIVVGAGISAAAFSEHVRLNGCSTPLLMITEDEFPPYDRVLLSKKPKSKGQDIRLRSDEFYKKNFIDIILKTSVTSVNLMHKKVTLSTGEIKQYSKLVLAMGGKPKKPSCPGGNLKNVFTLRSPSDAATIVQASAGKRLVCVGGSFIAMELASALADTAASVTVVCDGDEPLPFTGPDVGAVIRKKFEENGVHIVVKSSAEKYEGLDVVTGVTTSKGETIPADVVVAGIGIYAPTEWLKGSGIEMDEKGFIKVDEHFRTSADFVYAMGDVCTAPVPIWGIDSINIQHFQVAQAHGHLLGYEILGKHYSAPMVPFFWTSYFNAKFGLRLAGCPQGSSDHIVHGNVEELKFAKYYLKDGFVVAVLSAGPPVAVQFLDIFKRNVKVSRETVEKNTENDWMPLLKDIAGNVF